MGPGALTGRRSKHHRISGHIRRQIIDGRLRPGACLPTRDEMVRLYGTSKTTVQLAINQLLREGFACARGSAGTYVADNPPHLSHYGLVFEARPAAWQPWSRFWKTLQHEALGVQEDAGCELTVYYGSSGRTDGKDYLELLSDVQSHRVAGLVFAGPPFAFQQTPVLTQPDVPRVGVMSQPTYGIPAVFPDMRSFVARAMEHLRRRGRRRLGYLGMWIGSERAVEQQLMADAARRGLTLEPYCVQGCHFETAGAAANMAHVLMRLPPESRPDGLILADDNLVEPAVAGLIEAGVRIGQDVEVVAHCNYPLDTADVVPLKRLGFDGREILRCCLEVIDVQRRGARPPMMTEIPAVFEDELPRHAPDRADRAGRAVSSVGADARQAAERAGR